MRSNVPPGFDGPYHRGNNLDFESAVTAKVDEFKTVFIARLHVRLRQDLGKNGYVNSVKVKIN